MGNVTIAVNLGVGECGQPHLVHIDPSAVVSQARCECGRVHVNLAGEFDAVARISGSGSVFDAGTTRVFPDQAEHLEINVSYNGHASQVGLALVPDEASVRAGIVNWNSSDRTYRSWTEWAETSGVSVEHTVADLEPFMGHVIAVNGATVDTCISDETGEISFVESIGCSCSTFEVTIDTSYAATDPRIAAGGSAELIVRNHPNPAIGRTAITYSHSGHVRVSVKIYSTSGLLVRTLVDRIESAGSYSVAWDCRNVRDGAVAPGVYLCRLETRTGAKTHKLVLLK